MSTATVVLRCPACGQDLQAVVAPAPPTQWFPCPRCHAPVPVLRPREPAPLYSWEVLPGLYPALPRPRAPKWRARRAVAIALLVIVALAVAFAGVLAYYGIAATGPGAYAVDGTVYAQSSSGTSHPVSGASVTLDTEGSGSSSTVSDLNGAFSFAAVPSGGMTVHVSLSGYQPASVATFASPVYNAGTTGITVVLVPAGSGNSTNASLAPFPDLESFLASIGSGIVLLGIVAGVALIAAVLTLRHDRPAVGVVGGGAGLGAPFALYFLALGTPFPWIVAATGLIAGFGAFCLALRAVEIGQTSPAPGAP
jgi:hypothetical protein